MPYLQLRITIDPSHNRGHNDCLQLLNRFVHKWCRKLDPLDLVCPTDGTTAYTCGVEELNKFGEPCDPHFHLNVYFDPPDLKDPLRSAREFLRKNAIDIGFRLKGNKVWSCTLVEEPKDYTRWIRYPLKEKPVRAFCANVPNLEQLIIDSHNERKHSVELNVIKREKAIDKQSLKDKLFSHLAELDLKNHQQIWEAILNYYISNGKAVCFNTINGYTILYQLHIKLLTPTQCYIMRKNPQ